MNARLSSLLVAGGVVLAGIQAGSLLAAPVPVGSRSEPVKGAFLESATLASSTSGASILVSAPGFTGVPRLELLRAPLRVVVDLPGVQRGTRVSRKDLNALKDPLIHRIRVGQFRTMPHPVTRLVLDVVPGTQATVMPAPDGVKIQLTPGQGKAQAHLEGFASAILPLPAPASQAAPAVVVAQARPEPPSAAVSAAPLAPLPPVVSGFQTLPHLAASAALPAAMPEAIQTSQQAPQQAPQAAASQD